MDGELMRRFRDLKGQVRQFEEYLMSIDQKSLGGYAPMLKSEISWIRRNVYDYLTKRTITMETLQDEMNKAAARKKD